MVTAQSAIGEMVRRIKQLADPDQIILFGSRARGEGGPQSDYDILIVAHSPLPRWRRTVPLYRSLAGIGVPKEIVWWTPQEVSQWRGVRSHFISTAVREGKVLYEKPA
jgi:predicted nucleotidyltransferase